MASNSKAKAIKKPKEKKSPVANHLWMIYDPDTNTICKCPKGSRWVYFARNGTVFTTENHLMKALETIRLNGRTPNAVVIPFSPMEGVSVKVYGL